MTLRPIVVMVKVPFCKRRCNDVHSVLFQDIPDPDLNIEPFCGAITCTTQSSPSHSAQRALKAPR